VGISELACTCNTATEPRAHPMITNFSVWVETFSIMVAILSARFSNKGPEFFTYQVTIVRAERN